MQIADLVKVEHSDHNDVMELRPVVTWETQDPTAQAALHHQNKDNKVTYETEVKQRTLRKYDAIHHWFVEPEGDGEAPEGEESPSARMGRLIAKQLRSGGAEEHIVGHVPDWKTIRDNTTYLMGPAIGDAKELTHALKDELHDGYVHLDVDDMHSRSDRAAWSYIYKLFDLDGQIQSIIDEQIVKAFDAPQLLSYMRACDDDPIDIFRQPAMVGEALGESQRKWFWESRWVAEHLITHFPKFRKNWNVLIITGAGRRLDTDLKVSKLFRVLAKLGRINTKVVFID